MKLVFTGIQGCGKGTQARILAKKHGFKVIEMGTEFRKIVAGESELGKKLKKILDSGAQVPEELGREVMKSVLLEHKNKDIIYDGFIRNKRNLEVFEEIIESYKVVLFKLDIETAKDRLLGRMYDPETGETFQKGAKINTKTGTKLIKRDDDKSEQAIKKRFEEFIEKTLPILDIQQKDGKIIEVNANQCIEDVTKELDKKLGF